MSIDFDIPYIDQVYCSECGKHMTWPLQMVQIETYDVLSKYSMPIYGTACCKAPTFSSHDIHWDYCDNRPIDGERIENQDLTQLIALCCAIGKSPRSIRKNLHAFYFDIKSTRHRERYHKIMDKLLEA